MRAIVHRIIEPGCVIVACVVSLLASRTIIKRAALGGRLGKAKSAMDSIMNRFLVRVHTVLGFITDFLRKFFGMNGRDFGSQRMCPFCGLITSRRKACCLECGKSLKPA